MTVIAPVDTLSERWLVQTQTQDSSTRIITIAMLKAPHLQYKQESHGHQEVVRCMQTCPLAAESLRTIGLLCVSPSPDGHWQFCCICWRQVIDAVPASHTWMW